MQSSTKITLSMTRTEFTSYFKKKNGSETFCALCMTNDHATEQCSVYRTRWCQHFIRGRCRFGDRCSFAHTDEQLRALPD